MLHTLDSNPPGSSRSGSMMILRQLLSILILPFTVVVIVPAVLLRRELRPLATPVQAFGLVVVALGLMLVIYTISSFARRGRGTLAPWDPPRRLVISGVYRHVRNPMISGVLLILAGESLVFRSAAVAAWATVAFLINALYIPLVEEPGLARRFGADYEAYRHHVPRWIPRLSPWRAREPR